MACPNWPRGCTSADEPSIIDKLKGLSASPVHDGNSKLYIARRTKGTQSHCEALCAAGVLHGPSWHAGMCEEAGFMGSHPDWTNPLHGEARRENERVVGGGRERGRGGGVGSLYTQREPFPARLGLII